MDSRSYQANERRIEAIEKVAVFAAKLPRPVEAGLEQCLDHLVGGKSELACLYVVFRR